MQHSVSVSRARGAAALGLMAFAGTALAQGQRTHFTYLWHLEQPIYWPDRTRPTTGPDRYETAWTSIVQKDAGAANPQNNLREIFGIDDRKAIYQWRGLDAINAMRSRPGGGESGAQISYSGGLIMNVMSLGNANQLGYSPSWANSYRTARNLTTSGGRTRADIVLFSFHHALLPLVDEATVRKEIQLYKAVYNDAWGATTAPSQPMSRGFFPSEMSFSTRLIKPLADEGVAWSIVSSEKISRAFGDYPLVLGSGGANTDPPNRADQINGTAGSGAWYRKSISRGCSPVEAAPQAMTPRRARYVDPATGAVASIIVVPSSQSLSWDDGYAPIGTQGFSDIDGRGALSSTRPPLVMLAHDGDNAWGGGFSYYLEATPNLVQSAGSQGFVATTVEQYLTDHPVPANDFVHVEDGPWVNADGDFGAPQFINWNWPLLNASGAIDVENGWHVDARNWAVITAMQNRVETLEAISTAQGSPVNISRVLYPETAGTTPAERAWHYFLGSLNSGYMYYGSAIDMEVKPAVACNEAARVADPALAAALNANPAADVTPPTIWIPQRHPWNPGSINFGPQYGYRQVGNNGDFYVWTFAADVSGVQSMTLKYRIDADGQRSLSNTENETYAGGPGVGAWIDVPMTFRDFPAANVNNDPEINFNFDGNNGGMPTHIADQYWAKINGVREKLVDYYVEAVDARGNVKRSPIQHVWVGAGVTTPGGGGGNAVVIAPNPPTAGQTLTITYDPAGRPLAGASRVFLHWGINGWTNVVSNVPMTLAAGKWTTTITVPTTAASLEMAFNNGAGVWDNNGGADWRFPVQGGTPGSTWTIDGQRDADAVQVGVNGSRRLWAGLKGDVLYIASDPAGGGQDQFIYLAMPPGAGVLQPANWAKAGQIAAWTWFLADENDNAFTGWFNAAGALFTANVQSAAGAGASGVLEGTINLPAATGASLPPTVWIAAAPFANPNGGALLASQQVPAGNGNSNIDAAEYVRVDLCSLLPTGCAQPCYANCDGSSGSPALSPADFTCFLSAYRSGNDYANCDQSTGAPTLSPADFTCFLAKYRAGCP